MAFDWGNAFRGAGTGAAAGSSMGPWGTAIGGGLGALGGLFGGGEDEEKETNGWLDKIPDELKKYLMPYITGGQNALGGLNGLSDEYSKLYQDPNSIISQIGAGYKQSPGYQWRLKQGEQGITNAQAAGGMAGTGQHQQLAGELAENLANQDYNDYMKNALGVFGSGLEGATGIQRDIFGKGAGASGDLATGLSNYLQGRGGLNYTRSANKNQLNSDFFSGILSQLNSNKGNDLTQKFIDALSGRK